ncbi:AAEL001973-PA [Aedes aegypti]|uniref:AAEL001973-PA n=1 Tax=Aedes aegypti TaxID=7159 RepID=Q17JG9_AEDAE|nr:AAEL001973-PA [Aedes aegypti]
MSRISAVIESLGCCMFELRTTTCIELFEHLQNAKTYIPTDRLDKLQLEVEIELLRTCGGRVRLCSPIMVVCD